ncbi:hypothetical protein [Palleronia sp.]|uniref:hypothetical protein n=1 Tax=Palleronia sp. TaxID=1940284 RepID=UPI0035C7D6F6
MRRRDALSIHNERIKMFATIFNAAGVAFFGLGFARPLVDDSVKSTPSIVLFLAVSFAMWSIAYIVLGQLKTDDPEKETDL